MMSELSIKILIIAISIVILGVVGCVMFCVHKKNEYKTYAIKYMLEKISFGETLTIKGKNDDSYINVEYKKVTPEQNK